MISGGNQMTDNEVLTKFLLDIDCLEKLNPWTNKFNLFDILKISKTEIRHSNMLAWILDPNENHNLKDGVIRGLVENVIKQINTTEINVLETLLMDYYDFKILREWKNIDILAISDENKFLICIENKVFSGEHSNQLNKYKEIVDGQFNEYTKIYLYLTPQGSEASDNDNWKTISYDEIVKILKRAIEKTVLQSEVEMLLNNYIETVRWYIVGDKELKQVCNEIYIKHKRALDLIFEYKNDIIQEVSDFALEYLKEKYSDVISLRLDKCTKTSIRFTTPFMDAILPIKEGAVSNWNTQNLYFYELVNRSGTLSIKLIINRGNLSNEERDNYFVELIKNAIPKYSKKEWIWNTLYNCGVVKYDEDTNIEDIKEIIQKGLDRSIKEMLKKEKDLSYKFRINITNGQLLKTNTEIKEFASKYIILYKKAETKESELDSDFGDECLQIGFIQDNGESFKMTYPQIDLCDNCENLEMLPLNENHINILGNFIFSKWRQITHWSQQNLTSEENRKWFIVALTRLLELTTE